MNGELENFAINVYIVGTFYCITKRVLPSSS